MTVLVIVVNHNGQAVLRDCLASVARALAGSDLGRVLLVDNASTDDSVPFVRRHHPEVQIVANDANLGFAAANNIGIRIAMEEGCDHVYLLNPDTEVDPGFLEAAVAVAEEHPGAAAVQSKLLLHAEKTLINTIGNEINYLGFGYAGGYREPDRDLDVAEIPFASGASMLLRVTALREAGLFDEDFFLYQEDADLGWRLRLSGYTIVRAPGSVVYHKYAFSRGGRKFYFLERNRYRMVLQNYKVASLLLILPPLMAMQLGMLVYAAISGWLWDELKVMAHFLRISTWRSIRRARRRVQTRRRIPDREVVRWFNGRIAFEGLNNPVFRFVINPGIHAYWRVIRGLIRW
jgi:GT2 family glycosyltransferase